MSAQTPKGNLMNVIQSHFKSSHGQSIFYQIHPAQKAELDIILVHGLLEHSGRYEPFQSLLKNAGVEAQIYLLDLPGHGRSGGPRGDVPSFKTFVQALNNFYTQIVSQRTDSERPLLLIGHSVGGLVVYLTQCEFYSDLSSLPVDGVAFSSPAFKNSSKIPAWKKLASKLLAKTPAKTFLVPTDLIPEHLTRDPLELERARKETLILNHITPRLWESLLEAMNNGIQTPLKAHYPILFQIAGSDHIIDCQTSLEAYKKVLGNKKKILYPDSYHEIYNDLNRNEVFTDLVAWIQEEILTKNLKDRQPKDKTQEQSL